MAARLGGGTRWILHLRRCWQPALHLSARTLPCRTRCAQPWFASPEIKAFSGSLFGNPALPDTPADKVSAAKAQGVFQVTRHPMMWGFALWALAHILLVPNGRTLIVAGAILILALVGAHLQDRKKEVLLGDAWQHWEQQTRFWPQWQKLASAGLKPWAGGIALWLVATWAHGALTGIPAGLWLWIG